jgi:AcrR family transcriptional regulator
LDKVSEVKDGRRRRRRSDAERSAAAVLDAAVEVLGRRPEAPVEEIAAAAGVSRQTVYAHYPSRPLLLAAVVDRFTARSLAALDAAEATGGSVTDALLSWLDFTWRLYGRYPLFRHPSMATIEPAESERRHAPVTERLRRLIERGQAGGEFDDTLDATWLVSATIALGHAAGGEVAAGRMDITQAAEAMRDGIIRLYGAPDP